MRSSPLNVLMLLFDESASIPNNVILVYNMLEISVDDVNIFFIKI